VLVGTGWDVGDEDDVVADEPVGATEVDEVGGDGGGTSVVVVGGSVVVVVRWEGST